MVHRLANSPKNRGADLLMLGVRYRETLRSMRTICRQPLEQRLERVRRSVGVTERARNSGVILFWFSGHQLFLCACDSGREAVVSVGSTAS
jgi:hypothetical protein